MLGPVPMSPGPPGAMQRARHGCPYTPWTVLQEKILSWADLLLLEQPEVGLLFVQGMTACPQCEKWSGVNGG